jgi:hypothetical protein
MKKTLIILILFSLFKPEGESANLSPQAQISLLTCSSGTEIYSYFGHSAIRVNDPVNKLDQVYNYGVFSFETPNFIWRYCKGETYYTIADESMRSFMQAYYEEKRDVYEQVLNYNPSERQALYNALIENNKPENRVYLYKHFSDNCATRIRDQLEKAAGGKLKYDTLSDKPYTYRQLLDQFLPGNSWSGFGIKLALGIPCDRKTTFSQKMFLPAYLQSDMAKAVLVMDGDNLPFSQPMVTLFKAPATIEGFSLFSPAMVVLVFLAAVLGLSLWEYKINKRWIWLDFIVYLSFGIAGLILGFLCFFSILEATGWNLNLIWAMPTHFIFAFLLLFRPLREKLSWYVKLTTIILCLFLISMAFLPQTFHWLVIPLSFTLLLRSGGIELFRQTFSKILKTSHRSL